MSAGRVQTGVVETPRVRVVFAAGDVERPVRVQLENKSTGHVSAVEWTFEEARSARDRLQESLDALEASQRRAVPAPPPVRPRRRHAAGGGR